jgi:hypothetical protein
VSQHDSDFTVWVPVQLSCPGTSTFGLMRERNIKMRPRFYHFVPPRRHEARRTCWKTPLFAIVPFITVLHLVFRATACSASSGPVVINSTESAQPGDVIGLQGSGFGPNPEVWFARVSGHETAPQPMTRLEVLTGSDIFVAARIPSTVMAGLYAVWIRGAGRHAGPTWINRARPSGYEFPEVSPAGRFRIWGRNLAIPGSHSQVAFIDANRGTSFSAAVSDADQYQLSVIAPSNIVAGASYEIRISNGYGGKWGVVTLSVPLPARRSGIDHWNLRVPWAADFDYFQNIFDVKRDPRLAQRARGDGTTNDRPAIQSAIDKANAAGGGVVYLPPGNYSLKFSAGHGLLLRSRVVLQGSGKDQTLLSYGDGPSPPGLACPIAWAPGAFVSGIDGLTLRNTNERGHWLCNVRNLGGGSEFFVHNIRADLHTEGGALNWKLTSKVLLADSEFLLGAASSSPYWIEGSSWFIVRNNTFRYLRKRMAVIGSDHGLIEGNRSTRDGALRLIKPGDSGGLDVDSVNHVVILDNTFTTAGNVPSFNDGETINSQGCISPNQDLGIVNDASTSLLRDTGKHWKSLAGYVVAIVTGAGAGQWRQVVHNTPTDLAVDRPWQLVPSPGSRYVITQWSAHDLLVEGNRLRGNPRGIWLYCGGANVAIVNNTLLDSSGIWLRADQRMAFNRYNLIIGAVVAGNTIISQNGHLPACVSTELAQVNTDKLFGTGVFNLEVRRNTIRGSPNEPHDSGLANGLWNWVHTQSGGVSGPTSDTSVPGIVGSVFNHNNVSGCSS